MAINGSWDTGLMRIDSQSHITIRHLNLQNGKKAPNGIRITGSSDIAITQSVVAGAIYNGIHITETPSSDITISDTTFQDNGNVDVRTDTADPFAYHSRVLVTNNFMTATHYGPALANCGNSAATACQIRGNTITHVASSGTDLNRSHYAIVSGNSISVCLNGVTVDDSRNAMISENVVQGCTGDGIQTANGAVPANRPWSVSGNRVTNNTVTSNDGFGLASYGSLSDPNDRNEGNVWNNNHISGNRLGGCNTNVQNVFTANGPQTCAPQR
jgi:hypothetical protein